MSKENRVNLSYEDNIDWHQDTPEEKMYFDLLEEKKNTLSESARSLLGKAHNDSYLCNLFRYFSTYDFEEQAEARKQMFFLASCITEQDHKTLTEIMYAASLAGLSIDPEGEAWVEDRADEGNLFYYYRQLCFVLYKVLYESPSDREEEDNSSVEAIRNTLEKYGLI